MQDSLRYSTLQPSFSYIISVKPVHTENETVIWRVQGLTVGRQQTQSLQLGRRLEITNLKSRSEINHKLVLGAIG